MHLLSALRYSISIFHTTFKMWRSAHSSVSDFNYLKACQGIEKIRIGKNWTDYNVSLSEVSRYVLCVE